MWIMPVAADCPAGGRRTAPRINIRFKTTSKLGNARHRLRSRGRIAADKRYRRRSLYLERVGAAACRCYLHVSLLSSEFNYRLKWVNPSDLNAFALPGGPMYIDRGMLEAAKNEGEMAGVMAHELSHVALRQRDGPSDKAKQLWQPDSGHDRADPQAARSSGANPELSSARCSLPRYSLTKYSP